MLESVFGRARQAARVLRTAPGFSALVTGILGLAIAAATIAFSVVNATLLKPLPLRDADRLVAFEYTYGGMTAAFSPPTFGDFRDALRSFASVSACRPWDPSLTGVGEPERLQGLQVSGDFFDTLGIGARLGRGLERGDEEPGRPRVVVLSDVLWRGRFGGEPRLIGSRVMLDGEAFQVVGVMPAGFRWGRAWGRETQADVWVPYVLTPARRAEEARGDENLDVYARLKPQVTRSEAAGEVASVVSGLRHRFPERYGPATGWRVDPVDVQEAIVAPLRPGLLLVFLAVITLWLLAVVNVAGLVLARAFARRRELAVRAALGAGAARLAIEALSESLALAVLALAGGLAAAQAGLIGLERIDREALPRSVAFAIDGRSVIFAIGAMAFASLATGLVPAWHASRLELGDWLRARGARTRGRRGLRLRPALVVGQTALAVALLVGAGLLVRSFAALRRVPLGFSTAGVQVARVQLSARRYDAAAGLRLIESVLADVTGRAGIASVAAISELPLSGSSNSSSFEIAGQPRAPSSTSPHAETWSATPGYFGAVGIPVLRGRGFGAGDDSHAAAVAVVSETLASRYFPGLDPLGRRVDFEGSPGSPEWRTIVGVVGDVRDRGVERRPEPQLYAPMAQRPTRGAFFVVRTKPGAPDATATLRAAVKAADREVALFEMSTLDQLAWESARRWAVAGATLSAFASAALLLACLGLYGLFSQSLRERRHELAIRVSLGALRGDLMKMALGEGLGLVAPGVAIGTVLAFAGSGLERNLVFGVAASDPLTYMSVAMLLALAALVACAIPAWRASRVDPVLALRGD